MWDIVYEIKLSSTQKMWETVMTHEMCDTIMSYEI